MAYEVLVVDDEHEVRRAIQRALERRGYSVVLATFDGGIERIQSRPPRRSTLQRET